MAMFLGLADGNIPRRPEDFTESIITEWELHGIRCLSVHFTGGPASVLAEADELRSRLDNRGIHVAQMAGVNANFVHHDAAVRAEAQARVISAIPTAVALGATMVSSGCGTNRDDWIENFYGPHPWNFTAAAQDRLVDGLRGIAPHIEDAGLHYTIECHQLSVMRSESVIRDVLDQVDSPAITANFDPVNLLDSAAAVFDNAQRMRDIVATVGERYGPSCHIKDVRVTDELVCRITEVAPGTGVLDIGAYFEVAGLLPGPTALIVEHLTADEWSAGVAYVADQARAAGVVLL